MPMMSCIDCKRLTANGSRCQACTVAKARAKDRARVRLSPTQRGYNGEYRRNRKTLLATTDICWICGRGGADSADHIIPLSRGGSNDLINLRAAHLLCNKGRGNRMA